MLGSWICGSAVVGISTLYPSRMLLSAVVSVGIFLVIPISVTIVAAVTLSGSSTLPMVVLHFGEHIALCIPTVGSLEELLTV